MRLKRAKSGAGFTLIEILVSLVIIMIITALVRSSKTAYERSLFLSNLAYDVALSVREAQVSATNVRRDFASGSFNLGYGVEFASLEPTIFKLYADLNNTHYYDASPSPADAIVRTYAIKGGNAVSSLCVVYAATPLVCSPVTRISVSFRRPDSEACIALAPVASANVASPDCVQSTGISEARITLKAANNNTREVRVSSTGQISVY